MHLFNKLKPLSGYIIIILAFSLIITIQSKVKVPKTSPVFLKPPESIKYFMFGYDDLFTSMLWLRVLQNIDYCEGGRVAESDYVPPISSEKSKVLAVTLRRLKPSRCHLGWVYSMVNLITEITPRFKLSYEVGAPLLSVVVDDREGARLIYDKGLEIYPNDWQLSYSAAYHYLWEIQNVNRSAELLKRTVDNGGPPLMSSLLASIYTDKGKLGLARAQLLKTLEQNLDENVRKRLQQRLNEIEQLMINEENK